MTPDLKDALQLVTRFMDECTEHSDTCFMSMRAKDIEAGMTCSCEVAELPAALARIVRACEEYGKLVPRPVVAAVIKTPTGNYIIGQRKPGQWMAGKWCFVGGKVEAGETLEQAVIREVREELGLCVSVGAMIHEQAEHYEHGVFALHYFACELDFDQIPKLLECSDVASVPADRLPSYDLLPVDIDIAKRLALESENRRLSAAAEAPIPMLLFCPKCDLQHIDAPDERTPGWTNPPHKSHLCHGCGHIWRPSARATDGVAAIQTKGEKDGSPTPVRACEGQS